MLHNRCKYKSRSKGYSQRIGYHLVVFFKSVFADVQLQHGIQILEKDLSHMPETLILTAEFDPLRDEGEEYGKRLKEANNYVEIHRIPDALHGYFALGIRFLHVQESFEIMNRFLNKS